MAEAPSPQLARALIGANAQLERLLRNPWDFEAQDALCDVSSGILSAIYLPSVKPALLQLADRVAALAQLPEVAAAWQDHQHSKGVCRLLSAVQHLVGAFADVAPMPALRAADSRRISAAFKLVTGPGAAACAKAGKDFWDEASNDNPLLGMVMQPLTEVLVQWKVSGRPGSVLPPEDLAAWFKNCVAFLPPAHALQGASLHMPPALFSDIESLAPMHSPMLAGELQKRMCTLSLLG